jgi:hypothetical protein
MLDSITFFQMSSLPQALPTSERSAKQIVHMLVRLSKVWKLIMQPSRFYATMGQLVNEVLAILLQMVEDIQDIGEEDSKQINEVCKIFNGLETCFDGVRVCSSSLRSSLSHSQTSVGLHVHLWFKFAYLSEILDGSMVRIHSSYLAILTLLLGRHYVSGRVWVSRGLQSGRAGQPSSGAVRRIASKAAEHCKDSSSLGLISLQITEPSFAP